MTSFKNSEKLNIDRIVIIDYGLGNIRSILSKIERLNFQAIATQDPSLILQADRLILPGVGSFDQGMKNLEQLGLISILNEAVLEKKIPILGICLGMQLFSQSSEEGIRKGLNWLPATTKKFSFTLNPTLPPHRRLRIPHVGWNNVSTQHISSPLFTGIDSNSKFYFTHSFYMSCDQINYSIGLTEHGLLFTSSIQKNNIYGTQFHPEKSHTQGLKLIENFLRYS